MTGLTQERAPIYEALEKFQKMRVVPLRCRAIREGTGESELTALLGETCMQMDVNSMKPLDNLSHPVSVIADAERLAAEASGAAHVLMVGGTTSAVQSMVLAAVKRGEKIIFPGMPTAVLWGGAGSCGAVPVMSIRPVTRGLASPWYEARGCEEGHRGKSRCKGRLCK